MRFAEIVPYLPLGGMSAPLGWLSFMLFPLYLLVLGAAMRRSCAVPAASDWRARAGRSGALACL